MQNDGLGWSQLIYANHESNERQTKTQADEVETREDRYRDTWEDPYYASGFGSDFKNILRLLPTAIPIAFLNNDKVS